MSHRTNTDRKPWTAATRHGLRLTLGLLVCCAFIKPGPPQLNAAEPARSGIDEFNPRVLLKPLPAITRFPIATAAKAKGKIDNVELVLGVVVNGQARAYPINMLTGPSREILNDVVGGTAIAATW
jgi:hypothetical protein